MNLLRLFRRSDTDRLIAEAEKALAELNRPIEAKQYGAKQVQVRLCKECAWFSRGLSQGTCRSPKQKDFSDREGAEDWNSASLIRRWDCHGNWWESK